MGVGVTLAVAAAVLMGGWLLWVGRAWEMPMLQGTELGGALRGGAPCEDPAVGWGPSRMMGGWSSASEPALCPLGDSDEAETPSDIDEAQRAFERYVATLGYEDLLIVEVMEFEHNYYAIVEESESGVGAMELLLDKTTGAVGPEMGPNTM